MVGGQLLEFRYLVAYYICFEHSVSSVLIPALAITNREIITDFNQQSSTFVERSWDVDSSEAVNTCPVI